MQFDIMLDASPTVQACEPQNPNRKFLCVARPAQVANAVAVNLIHNAGGQNARMSRRYNVSVQKGMHRG